MRSFKCDGCRYWSERVAACEGGGPIEALCLCKDSPNYFKMVAGGCDKKEIGQAIDDPAKIDQ